MAGTSRLGWVVANFGTVLMTKEQFDRGVAVEYPASAQGFEDAVFERSIHPCDALRQLRLTTNSLFLSAFFVITRCQLF